MIIQTAKELDDLAEALKGREVIAFDFETTDLHHKLLSIEGLAIACDDMEPAYIPFNKDLQATSTYLFAKNLFAQDSLFVGHNLTFDLKVVKYFFGVWPKNYFDTFIAAWYIDENSPKDLKSLATRLLGKEMIKYKEAAKDRNTAEGYKIFVEYAERDAVSTLELHHIFAKQLKELKKEYVFFELEMPFIEVLVSMVLAGIHVDQAHLQNMAVTLQEEKDRLLQEIYEQFGGEFNVNSPAQLSERLYGISVKRVGGVVQARKIDPTKPDPILFTKKNAPATSDRALQKLGTKEAKLLQKYREVEKQLSTYALGYQRFIIDGCIWPNFNPIGTVTGRLSSSQPNMQNLTADKEDTPPEMSIRKAFFVPDGYDMIVADESQLELRVLAHYSKDPTLLAAFNSGGDIHSATAAMVLKKPVDQISKDERRFFKTLNFAVIYGMGPKKMADMLEISEAKAKSLLSQYFETYWAVQEFIGNVETQVSKHGYVRTILGRYRRLPEVFSSDNKLRFRALRQAVNSVIQGSAADILKAAMVRIYRTFQEEQLDAKILLQIHDELVIRVKHEHAERAADIVKHHMEHPFNVPLDIPLIVEPKICKTWREGK